MHLILYYIHRGKQVKGEKKKNQNLLHFKDRELYFQTLINFFVVETMFVIIAILYPLYLHLNFEPFEPDDVKSGKVKTDLVRDSGQNPSLSVQPRKKGIPTTTSLAYLRQYQC